MYICNIFLHTRAPASWLTAYINNNSNNIATQP